MEGPPNHRVVVKLFVTVLEHGPRAQRLGGFCLIARRADPVRPWRAIGDHIRLHGVTTVRAVATLNLLAHSLFLCLPLSGGPEHSSSSERWTLYRPLFSSFRYIQSAFILAMQFGVVPIARNVADQLGVIRPTDIIDPLVSPINFVTISMHQEPLPNQNQTVCHRSRRGLTILVADFISQVQSS